MSTVPELLVARALGLRVLGISLVVNPASGLGDAPLDHEEVLAIADRVSTSATLSCAGKAALLAAYVQLYSRPDFNGAEQRLRAAERRSAFDLDARIGAAYLRGVLDHGLGQLDESLAAFERAARLAQLIGDDNHHASALVMQADALARLGRFAEAQALASEVEQRAARLELARPSLARLAFELRLSAAWIAVLRREDDPGLADPSADLRALVEAHASSGDRRNLADLRLDLALAAIQSADLDGAEAELAALEVDALDPDLLVWFELTSARVALLRGRFTEAEHHLERARLLADLNQDRELEWRVAITGGELERARGRDDAAIEQFRVASRVADELALAIAGSAGRSRFVTIHSRADVALVELLLARGQTEAAMCTAMAARSRHLRGLWARLRPALDPQTEQRYRDLLGRHRQQKLAITARLERSWALSTAELEGLREQLKAEGARADQLLAEATGLLEHGAPTWTCAGALPQRPGDAVLTMFPGVGGGRWTFFLAHRSDQPAVEIERVAVQLNEHGFAEAAASAALDRLAATLEHAERLRVTPIGAFVAVDFHRLWLARGRLEPTITYSLGLGAATDPAQPCEARAAVVAGSTNLAAVGREASAVTEHLRALGWRVEPRWQPDAGAQPGLLHYAGHGYDDGSLGWQSAIELPGFGRLSAAQIVVGQRSPELVVLGACDAGRVVADSIDGGMNLAAAFLLAGAQLVIAPIHEVDDDAALELGRGLYRELPTNAGASPDALARALARLQRDELARAPAPAQAQSHFSWRAWGP